MESKIIDALQLVLPLIKSITNEDIQLSLCDTEKAIATKNKNSFVIVYLLLKIDFIPSINPDRHTSAHPPHNTRNKPH